MNRFVPVFFFFALVTASVSAQKPPVFSADGAAIRGYDAVAYFKEAKATKGDPKFAYPYQGATWLFANAQNLADFKATPEAYAPQYGGYCAYGSADGTGHKAPTDPEAWAVVGNKLYLNYNKAVQTRWKQDTPGYIEKADKNWPTLKDKE